MSRPTVFIHTNDQQLLGARVAEHALRKASRHNDQFDIRILNLKNYPQLLRHDGDTYLRKQRVVRWNNEDLQSFSPLRFLPPQEMGFQGRAVVLDPDIFARADIYELLTRDMQGKAICCRYVEPTDGRPPFYNTSVMLLDCARLRHWEWDRRLDDLFNHRLDYGDWIFLRTEPEGSIGVLEEEWNHFDTLTEQTKLLHNTERCTQPWKTGLPVDFNLNYAGAPDERFLRLLPRRWIDRTLALLGRPPHPGALRYTVYKPHPDPRQEEFFFSLLSECVRNGTVSLELVEEHIHKQNVRPDALKLVEQQLMRKQAA